MLHNISERKFKSYLENSSLFLTKLRRIKCYKGRPNVTRCIKHFINMPYMRISVDSKQRIVDAFERDEDYVQVAEILGVSQAAAYGIVRRYQVTGNLERPRGGRREAVAKMDEDMAASLVEIVQDFPAYTLGQINAELQRRLPDKPHVSRTTVVTALDGQLIRTKKLEDAPIERNSPRTKTARRNYANWMLNDGVNQQLIFIDESGFNLFTRRTRGRAVVGQRAVRQVAGSRGRSVNIIMAISPETGLVYHEVHIGTVNMIIFNNFVYNISMQLQDYRITLVMDNAAIHNQAPDSVVTDDHVVRKLPAYSPMLNPIELAFSALKAPVKRVLNERMAEVLNRDLAAAAGLTLTAYRNNLLRGFLENSLPTITAEKCRGWYNHTHRYLLPALNNQDIFM